MQKKYAEVKQNDKIFNGYEDKDKSLKQLQNKISLSNFQMLELTLNDQKFSQKIQELNEKAFVLIKSTKFQEALVYLAEAQKLLQYAAGRGCSLDRQAIIKILNNQAVVYQKIWDMERSISYLEAIIFHINSFLQLDQNKDMISQIKLLSQKSGISSKSQEEIRAFLQKNYEKVKTLIAKKFTLSLYFLQFSLLNTQNQGHKTILQFCMKAAKSYQDTFQTCLNFMKLKKNIFFFESLQSQSLKSVINLTKEFKSFSQLTQQDFIKNYANLKTKFEQKSSISNSFHFILQKYSSLEKKQAEYKNFSLNTVIELYPQSFQREILEVQKVENNLYPIKEIDNQNDMSRKILQYSAALLTVSSQMRENFNNSIQNSIFDEEEIFQDFRQRNIFAQKLHLLSLKISVEIVEQLSQFAGYSFKSYTEIYANKIKTNAQSLTKIDCLKEKYKSYINNADSINSKEISLSQQVFDHTMTQYSISVRPSIKAKEKQNMLEKLFKQNTFSTPQKVIKGLPRLNFDLSQIQSMEYGASKTFKQKNDFQSNIKSTQDETPQQQSNFNIIQIKKILTVPNISVLSSKKQSQISSKNKSKSAEKQKKQKSKLKNDNKPIKQNNKNKSVSSFSKNKFELKKFMSPKNFIQKSKKSPQKRKYQRKFFIQNQKGILKNAQKKVSKTDNKVKNKQKNGMTRQQSNRNISLKSQIQKEQFKTQSSRKFFKLRKAKSFEEVITPFEDIKPIIFQSKDISSGYKFPSGNNRSKVKLIEDSKRTKSTQNIKFQTDKKDKLKRKDQKIRNMIQISSKNGQKKLQQLKNHGVKKKKSSQIKIKQTNSQMAWKQKAVRMSSMNNLMQSMNKKQGLKKVKSSQSIQGLNSSSDYFMKGFNMNSSQRTKAGSLAITQSIRYI